MGEFTADFAHREEVLHAACKIRIRRTDQSQTPSVDDDDAIAQRAEGNVSASAERFRAFVDAEIAKVEIMERTRCRIDPKSACDVDAAALTVCGFELKSDLGFASRDWRGEMKAVAIGESIVEHDVRVRAEKRLAAIDVGAETTAHKICGAANSKE